MFPTERRKCMLEVGGYQKMNKTGKFYHTLPKVYHIFYKNTIKGELTSPKIVTYFIYSPSTPHCPIPTVKNIINLTLNNHSNMSWHSH